MIRIQWKKYRIWRAINQRIRLDPDPHPYFLWPTLPAGSAASDSEAVNLFRDTVFFQMEKEKAFFPSVYTLWKHPKVREEKWLLGKWWKLKRISRKRSRVPGDINAQYIPLNSDAGSSSSSRKEPDPDYDQENLRIQPDPQPCLNFKPLYLPVNT